MKTAQPQAPALTVGVADSSLKYWNLLANGVAGRAEAGGGKYYYLKDHLGSTRSVVDQAGLVQESYDYYPFGLYIPGRTMMSGLGTKEHFTGKERDTETGWDYFGARYYDAVVGRWWSVDPQADDYVGLSPYNYAANNPLYYTDPDGEGVIGAIVGGAAGGYYAYKRTTELLGGNTQGRGWDVFYATVTGAGLGALAGGLDVTEGAGVILGGLAAGAGEAAAQYFATGEISDPGQVGLSTAFGFAGAGIGKALFKYLPVAKSLAGDELSRFKTLADIFKAGPASFGENVVGSVGATEFFNWGIDNGHIQTNAGGEASVSINIESAGSDNGPTFRRWVAEGVWQDKDGNFHLR